MKTNHKPRRDGGYVTYAMVLATAAMLTVLTLYAYRRAVFSQSVQSDVQLRSDYSEKEDAVLRSIVAIVPNRAIRAMQNSSAVAGANRDSLRWQNIFADALAQANASSSVSAEIKAAIGKSGGISANTGDGAMGTTKLMFTNVHGGADSVYVTPGLNRAAQPGYPDALVSTNGTVNTNDLAYPIISWDKNYSGLKAREYKATPLKYPAINFGYAKPGENFIAKRNWWAFSMGLAGHDSASTSEPLNKREFVLSIYEVPSQLAISASRFAEFGTYADGSTPWEGIEIAGNVFADKAKVNGGDLLESLASRRGMAIDSGATIGGQSFSGNPFKPGVREQYEVTTGEFFPVSMPSESGRATFIPINRGSDFFDRHAPGNVQETSTLSTTTWNEYSSGALQCAMQLDVTKVASAVNASPTELRLSYLKNGVRVPQPFIWTPTQETSHASSLPDGFVEADDEEDFDYPVDVAYGRPGLYYFKYNVQGPFKFNYSVFNMPWSWWSRRGYYRSRIPFSTTELPGGKICVEIHPERLPSFLASIGADDVTVNNSIVVNSDYTASPNVRKPNFPSEGAKSDYGLILNQCANLSAFKNGFSVVTNYMLFIGSDFNTTSISPPAGYNGPLPYYPPCSLFAPQKRYGSDEAPFSVGHLGQVSSLGGTDAATSNVAPKLLDSMDMNDNSLNGGNTTINLRPMTHRADIPPITMMNWLVVLEERRKEFW